MKKLPEIDLQVQPLFDISNGRIKTQLLVTAIELNIFDYLSTPQSSGSVARQLNTYPAYTRFLLDGLSALHLLEKKDDRYQNLPDTQTALHRESSTYVGAMFTMMDQTMSASMTDLTQKVVSGPQDAPTDLGDEAIWQEYARSMANFQRCGPAQNMAAMISKINAFAGFQKMLDLGGGPGLYCIAMVAEHPNMQGIIFDQPAVVKVAEEFIAEYEMQDRVSTVGGDYINDPIGEGFDLI